MTLINKIGLIGLLGVVALIVIYLIRPNYQQKTGFQYVRMETEPEKEEKESAGKQDTQPVAVSVPDAGAYVPCDGADEAGDRT